MNFLRLDFLFPVLIFAIVLVSIVLLLERKLFKFVKTYWFYKRSFWSYLSTLFFLLGMTLLLLGVLDLRGPEEKIKAQVPTERTIILIDTSASMLAEDVKPSRLQKAVLIAKHFARKAAGQQLSVVAFAEIQKKIVPFTNDLDLIDSRLESLKMLRNQYGSSALTIAIQETIQYFQEAGDLRGNIIVLTDGEETSDGVKLKIPKDINVALVGIGTAQGGRIPLDDGRGFRFGYKKDRGVDVITKLSENFFKSTVEDISNAKYWITNSYTLPSEEILEFFAKGKLQGGGEQDMIIRPVHMEWLAVPAILLLILSYVLKSIRVFTLGLLFITLPLQAQGPEIKLSQETIQDLELLQAGKLDQGERLKLADELRKAGMSGEALELFKENLNLQQFDPNLPPETYLNYGTALLQAGDTQNGLGVYDSLLKNLPQKQRQKFEDMIEKNIMTHFIQQEQKKKEQEKKKDQKQKQGNDQQESSGEGQNQGMSGQSKPSLGQNKGTNQEKSPDKEGSKSVEEKDNAEESGDKNEQDQDKDKDKEGKPNEADGEKKPLPNKKLPAKLKQLMSDDRQLQMRMIENGTRDLNKRKSRTSKDW
jgi:Ca-activated chloride channel homolog